VNRRGLAPAARPQGSLHIGCADVSLRRKRAAPACPRILRWRDDKPLHEADTLAALEALLAGSA
jgi:hypothetical protein